MSLFIFFLTTVAMANVAETSPNPFASAKATLKADGTTDSLEFFTGDEKAVKFEMSFEPQGALPTGEFNFVLVQVDSDRLIERYFGVLNDKGLMGDKRADDGVYSRKVQFKERKSRVLSFAIFYDKGEKPIHKGDVIPENLLIPVNQELAVPLTANVKGRPSFLEVIASIWNRFWEKPQAKKE